MSKLTDTQTVVLNRAANHPGGFVDPEAIAAKAPTVRHAILASLVKKGLLAEVEAGREDPVWRKTDTGNVALRLTAAGKAALGIEEGEPPAAAAPAGKSGKGKAAKPADKSAPKTNGGKPTKGNATKASEGERERHARKPAKAASAETSKPAPKTREGTKQARLIEMLTSAKGVTIEEASAALGWLPHTTRAAISHGIGKRLGRTIVSTKDERRGRVYRIVD